MSTGLRKIGWIVGHRNVHRHIKLCAIPYPPTFFVGMARHGRIFWKVLTPPSQKIKMHLKKHFSVGGGGRRRNLLLFHMYDMRACRYITRKGLMATTKMYSG